MQYLLTEREYVELNIGRERRLMMEDQKLQKLCTQIADTMPILYHSNTEAAPWGCILTVQSDSPEHYCDECPVQEICPCQTKEYSK